MRLRSGLLVLLWVLFVLGITSVAAALPNDLEKKQPEGSITMPLARYRALEHGQEPAEPKADDTPVLWSSRRIEGNFRKGLWTGRLVSRFEVLSKGSSRVPVLDAHAVLGEVLLDGKPAALLEDGPSYVLPLDRGGKHELAVDFYWGRESPRFTRSLRFVLPEGGPIEVEARIAERGITPSLSSGALMQVNEDGEDTRIVAFLDGSGELGLSWKLAVAEENKPQAHVEVSSNTLFHVTDALVTGRSAFRLRVTEGETDEVHLVLPPSVEVLRVEGAAVLQWFITQGKDGSRGLVVLLRHFVSDEALFDVDFQLSEETKDLVSITMPTHEGQTTGSFGIVGPPGLRLLLKNKEGAEELTPRDIPSELLALAHGPILLGYRLTGTPRVVLSSSPLPEIKLSRTVVDELSASTVLGEDGVERTKIALRIRNDGRQYVELTLPEGARPKHSFLDGREVRPALLGQRLLLPLRQSEKLTADKTRIHVVRAGETLSDVANLYYSDPSAWQRIVAQNRDVVEITGVLVRETRLKIPPAAEAMGEAFFVIEVAYERTLPALSMLGVEALRLPGLDIDTTKAVWHVYMPTSVEPLSFHGNLTQWSRIKYDPFRRIQWYLESALSPSSAFAGGDYENILQKRRAIYNDEASKEGDGISMLSVFPLVGQQYRFRRILLGREVPELHVWYASKTALTLVRRLALGFVFMAVLFALRRRTKLSFLLLSLLIPCLLLVAHYVPGLHRQVVWGVDLALLVFLVLALRKRARRMLRILLRAPWIVIRSVTLRRVIAAGGFALVLGEITKRPLLLPLALLVLFSVLSLRLVSARKNSEVSHV